MSDTSYPVYQHYGTNAERLAFTPDPPATGQPIYIWYETDTGNTYLFNTTWHLIAGAAGGAVNFSAGTTSQDLTNVVFSNSNGISFGLNGSTITAAHNGLTSQLAQQVSAANGSYTFTNLSFSNANGVSFITSAGSAIAASIATSLTNINISAGTQSQNLSALVFSNSNGISFGLDGSTITASGAGGGGLTNINISAGTTSNNLSNLVFSNSNGISFGLDGSTVTAAHNGLTSQSNQALSAANGSFTFQTAQFSNANGVSFITSAGSAIAASIATSLTNINVSAGTTSNNLSALVFSNSNGVSFGLDGSTITASAAGGGGGGATLFYWENLPYIAAIASVSLESRMKVNPFVLPQAIDPAAVAFIMSNSIAGRTFGTTGANSTFTGSHIMTMGFNVFTKMTGASSLSFSNLAIGTAGSTFMTSISCNANGSQYTISVLNTYFNIDGISQTSSTSFASSSGSFVIPASVVGAFSGIKLHGVQFTNTLSAGDYWAGFAFSSTSSQVAGIGIADPHVIRLINSPQVGSGIIVLGETGQSAWNLANGFFSTNGQFFSRPSFNLSQITASSANSHAIPYFHFRNMS